MKNSTKFKKYIITNFLVISSLFILFFMINAWEYHRYTINFNNKISSIIDVLMKKYPDINENEIIEILNSEDDSSNKVLDKYGIDIYDESILLKNDKDFLLFSLLNMLIFILLVCFFMIILTKYNKRQQKEINNITNYIEQINMGNYSLSIDSISEDELSILKNEIYKTTIKLKEVANNSYKDKINLKKSLEDISHQLKTPLTSILVMLDNLIDDNEMNPEIRNDFIIDIKRNIININFLVQSILKLSKFDSNTISFIREDNSIKNILEEATKNISTLCDLKNINIKLDVNENIKVNCDYKWEVEALSNILKNCVEHSYENNSIDISAFQNKVYTQIVIKDYGEGISKGDLPHIFERFYKGKNSSSDSVGIGLSLSKTIIENDNGTISISSSTSGTVFTIKYYIF